MSLDFKFDQKRLEKEIVREAVQQLFAQRDPDTSGQDIFDSHVARIRQRVDAKVDAIFHERAEKLVAAKIEDAIENAFSREYQAVDSFGRPSGDKTTIQKRLNEITSGYWSQKVDRNGKPASGYDAKQTRAEFVMLRACGESFAEDLKQNAVNVTAHLKDGLRAELRQWTDRTLADLFNVRSQSDKDEGRRK